MQTNRNNSNDDSMWIDQDLPYDKEVNFPPKLQDLFTTLNISEIYMK